jgi:hypothetical protein
MKENSLRDHLNDQLRKLGFGNKLDNAIDFYKNYPSDFFQLPVRERNDKESVDYLLYFKQKDIPGDYELMKYDVLLRMHPEIASLKINAIDVGKLDKSMKQVDWSIDHHSESIIEEMLQSKTGKQKLDQIDKIFIDVNNLHTSSEGNEIAEKLMFKYWSGGPYEPNQFSLQQLKQKYEYKLTIPSAIIISKDQAYEMVQTIAKRSNQTNLITQKTNVMNEQNFEYLKDNIKYMGFGEKLNEQLENNLKQGKDEFQLGFNTDMYFFNSYKASLERSNGEKMDQTFYLNKSKGVTAKEAYNLLEGRSVHKELLAKETQEPYKAWLQLDFKSMDKNNNHVVNQYHENYGFDLKAAFSKFSIADMNDPEKEKALIQSLQKGNVQAVTMEKDGIGTRMFIEANPQFKTVNVFDGQMKRVQKESLEQYKSVKQGGETSKEQKQEVKQDVSKNNKQAVSQKTEAPKIKSSKKKSVSM